MNVRPRFALLAIVGLALCCAPAVQAQPAALHAATWPQATSDVKADPAVRFGILPNGMRYAIAHSSTPKGEASLRLRMDVGSLDETDAQQGLAHFLEHMAFEGSTHVPEGQMIKILQRLGLAFGADTNASTSWTETVYQLDLPSTADATVDTGLMLMRDVGGELTIGQGALDRERGVVLAEERTRDGPELRMYKDGLAFDLKGQLAADRMPIGKAPVIEGADSARMRDLYQHYYRPDRAVLVAVGDFDVDAMEAKIKARFSDWAPKGPAGPDPDYGTPGRRGIESRVMVDPGVQLSVQAAWVRPADTTADSLDKRRLELVRQLAFRVLDRRLDRMSRSDAPPFIAAYAYKDDRFHSAEITTLQVTPQPGRWQEALAAAMAEERRLVQFGVRQDELDREITEARAGLRAQAAGIATRTTRQFADSIVETLDDRDVFTSPVQDLALFDQATKGLNADAVSAAGRAMFQGDGPLVFLASPSPIDGGEAAVTRAFRADEAAPLKANGATTVGAWPYASFGTPGKVVERREMADLGATLVRFGNGVRLTVRPSAYKRNQVLVRARIGDGMLGLPHDRADEMWAAEFAFVEGGLKDLTADQIDQVLSSKVHSAGFDAAEDAFVLQGATQPKDFPTEMQLLTAYASQPGFRAAAFQRLKTYYSTLAAQMEATPGGVMQRDLPGLLHGGDPRFLFPSPAEIAASSAQAFQSELQPRLAQGPIEVTITGDITVDEAIAQTAATFATLPARTPVEIAAAARTMTFPGPTATPVTLTHHGRPDQAAAYMAWPAPDFFQDPQQARTLRVLAEVIESRLVDDLREAQGVTYSPEANASASLVFTGYGDLAAAVEVPPQKIGAFFDTTAKITADLAAKPVSQDELDRAKKPLLEGMDKARQTNEYWLEQLSGAQAEPRKFDAIRSVVADLEKVTPADLQKAAATFLKPDKAWKLQVTPAASAAAPAAK